MPKLQVAGWDNEPYSIAEQQTITAGRIVPVGKTYTVTTGLLSGQPVVLNGTFSGTVTTHPDNYVSATGSIVSGLASGTALADFIPNLSRKSVTISGSQGSGNYSVMAVLLGLGPERWRIAAIFAY